MNVDYNKAWQKVDSVSKREIIYTIIVLHTSRGKYFRQTLFHESYVTKSKVCTSENRIHMCLGAGYIQFDMLWEASALVFVNSITHIKVWFNVLKQNICKTR